MDVPDLLIRARTRAGLSQAALARRASIPRSALNVYERGRREPGAAMLLRILAAAGFEIQLQPRLDHERAGRILIQVLELAEALPFRPSKTLRYPAFRRRAS